MQAGGIRYIHHPSRSDEFKIYAIGDLHVGNAGCWEKKIREDVARIAEDPHAFWMGMGDYCDFITHKDKRFDPTSYADWVKVSDIGQIGGVSLSRVVKLLSPIRDRCLGMLLGNHERSYMLHSDGFDIHRRLCEALGVANLGYCCFLDVAFSRGPKSMLNKGAKHLQIYDRRQVDNKKGGGASTSKFRIFAHHGAGAATTPGGKLNKLIKAMASFDADVYFLNHVHDSISRKEPSLCANADCTELVERKKVGVVSGSYLRSYTQTPHAGYGEVKLYNPVNCGANHVRIKPDTREIWAEV